MESVYESYLKSKHLIPSNKFTVLASILANDQPLCITTGVKCVPDSKIRNSQGMILHDSHAEILAIRAFNYYILKSLKDIEHSLYFEKLSSGLYGVKSDVKFSLYISEIPCGDASLENLMTKNTEPWKHDFTDKNPLRGREYYTQTGLVRTKPGRADSLLSKSKSCSDKLTLVTLKGLLNCLTQDLFEDQIYLDSIIVPKHLFTDGLKRCFTSRVAKNFSGISKTTIVTAEVEDTYNKKLSNLNLGRLERPRENEKGFELATVSVPSLNFYETTTQGVRNGSSIKRVRKTNTGYSELSRKALLQLRQEIHPLPSNISSYQEWKMSLKEYQNFKTAAKAAIGNWGESTKDDFQIEQVKIK